MGGGPGRGGRQGGAEREAGGEDRGVETRRQGIGQGQARQKARISISVNGEGMSPRQPADCETMDQVRVEIDRIDTALVDLVAERFGYVERAWQLKSRPEEATVPWRIQQVIDRVR